MTLHVILLYSYLLLCHAIILLSDSILSFRIVWNVGEDYTDSCGLYAYFPVSLENVNSDY